MGYNVFTEYLLDMVWLNTRQDKTKLKYGSLAWIASDKAVSDAY